jgi:cytoskeletal protein CcmA (bactofilin family)
MNIRFLNIWTFIVILGMIPGAADATKFIGVKGDTYLADTVYSDDLFISGNKLKMQGRVEGDLFAFCQEIVLTDSVEGSFNSFSMNIQTLGPVKQSFRGFGNSINCNAPVGKNLLIFGNQVTVGPQTVVGHNGDIFCAKLVFQGRLEGDLHIDAEEAEILGFVGGDVDFKNGHLEIGPDAVIEGDIYYKSSHKATISKSARISGEINWEEVEEDKGGGSELTLGRFFAWLFSVRGYLLILTVVSLLSLIFSVIPFPAALSVIFYSIVFLISGNVVILLTKERLKATMATINNRFLPSLGLGFVVFFVVPVISLVILFTFLGAPLGIALLFLFGVALLIGSVYAAAFFGSKFWRIVGRKDEDGSPYLNYSTGIVLLVILSFIPILGYLLVTAVIMTGLGGLSQTFKSTKF